MGLVAKFVLLVSHVFVSVCFLIGFSEKTYLQPKATLRDMFSHLLTDVIYLQLSASIYYPESTCGVANYKSG